MLVEFENVFLIGGIFYNWGQLGANVIVEFEIFFYLGAFFYNWGHGCFGANLFLFGGIHVCNFFQFWIGCKFV